MALFNSPTTIVTNAQAPADVSFYNKFYNKAGVIQSVNLDFLQGAAGAPTFSAQPQQSSDGTNWDSIGSAISALGASTITVTRPYFRLHIPTLSAGGLTVLAS